VIVMVTVDEEGNCLDGATAETRRAADGVGRGCGGVQLQRGPATVLSVIERMRAVTTLPLAAMPNAGMPRVRWMGGISI
jgi:methionine synthase I (cobalamin-dependent)